MGITESCSAIKQTRLWSEARSWRPGACAVRKAVKDRLIITGLGLAALPVAICSVSWAHTALDALLDFRPWAHMTLEVSLNLLWLLLAMGALAQWLAPDGASSRRHLTGLVSLVFILLLLLPVISANDDLAQRDLINDARTSHCISATLKSERQIAHSAELLDLPVVQAVRIACFNPATYEVISEPSHAASVAAPGNATGNHSPPCG